MNIFLVNRYFQVVMLITKEVFIVKTSSFIILPFKLTKNFTAFSYRRIIAL